jgi:hypothetical protein
MRLLDRGYDVVGTLRNNRLGLPHKSQLCQHNDPVGTVKMFQLPLGKNTLYLTSWMDKKVVNFLSTIPSAIQYEDADVDPEKAARNVPTIKYLYDHHMGGTDTFDQQLLKLANGFRARNWHEAYTDYYLCVAYFCAYDMQQVQCDLIHPC